MNKKNEKAIKKIDVKEDKKIELKKLALLKKKKKLKNITSGIAFVYSTFNNTIISIADENGNVVSWSSAGAKVLKDQENLLLTLLKLLQMTLGQKLMNKV